MKTICCYTDLNPDTAKAIAEFAPDAELIETPRDDHFKYVRVIGELWGCGEDLVIIEQDKVITADTLPSFSGCAEDWCSFHYEYLPAPFTKITGQGLGCTRFSAAIQKSVAATEFVEDNDATWYACPDCGGKNCWRALDTRIAKTLFDRGLSPHDHGWIKHLHNPADDALQKERMTEWAESLRGPG